MVLLSTPRALFGQDAAVPAGLQAQLLAKLAPYDRNFKNRAGPTVQVLIVTKKGNGRSELAAAAIKSAFERVDTIGGLPHAETTVVFESAQALARRCTADRVSILYVTPGLDEHVAEIGAALKGVDVLSISAVPEHVPLGVVLGFEVVSGKPNMVVNLPQARMQKVDFKVEVLKLMRVYR